MVSRMQFGFQRKTYRCGPRFVFQLPFDVSHFFLKKAFLGAFLSSRASSCKSIIEILDGSLEGRKTPIDKICSPQAKQIRDQTRRNLQQKSFLSTENSMVIIFRRPSAPLSTNEAEFVTGAYFFHDGKIIFHGTFLLQRRQLSY